MKAKTEFVNERHMSRCSWHLTLRMFLCLALVFCCPHAYAQEVVYERVTDASQLLDGGKYIIVGSKKDYAMGVQNANNRTGVNIKNYWDGDVIKGLPIATKEGEEDKVYEFSLYQNSWSRKWGLYDSVYKGFLFAPDSKDVNHMQLKGNNNGNVPVEAEATIQITKGDDGEIVSRILFPESTKNKERLLLHYLNSGGKVYFSCYNKDYKTNVVLYRKRVGMFNISRYSYSTYTCNIRYRMPQGCTGFVVLRAIDEGNGVLLLAERYKEGDIVPANTPLLIKGDEGQYSVYQTARKSDAELETRVKAENLLHGEFDAEGNVCYDIANKEKYEYFKLNVKDGQNIGFYWGAPDGAPFKMTRTDRAYLVLPREEARRVKGLMLDEAMVETRINSPAEHALPSDKVYDLSGRICQGALAPGIYIRGGRKVLGGGKKIMA